MIMKEININFFGDSICFGQGVSLIHGWVPKIAKDLYSEYSEKGVEVSTINNAVNGRTTRQALESMHYEIGSNAPDILIIQFGMNDCNYWETDNGLPRVNKTSFKHNLIEIVQRAIKYKTSKIILNTNHPTTRTEKFSYADCSYQDSNEEYNNQIREVAKENKNIILNDIENKILNHVSDSNAIAKFLLNDRLHLSKHGHDFYHRITFTNY